MPAALLLVAFYLGLFIALLRQLFLVIKEKFKDRERFVTLTILTTVLVLTYFKPFGLIDFDKLQGNDILIAQQEGAVNCMTIFKLKKNNKFREKNICFGTLETKGDYRIQNDTIFFENVIFGRYENGFYKFAVIRPSKYAKSSNRFDLIRYKDYNDTIGHELKIIKNDLYTLKEKKPNR
jgi:hypothetical protein